MILVGIITKPVDAVKLMNSVNSRRFRRVAKGNLMCQSFICERTAAGKYKTIIRLKSRRGGWNPTILRDGMYQKFPVYHQLDFNRLLRGFKKRLER
jgi:hypothetical protein